MAKEQFKSVMLISLFGICVLLVSQIWSDLSLDIFNHTRQGKNIAFEKIQIKQIISPQGFVFNFGGKSHIVNYSDKYQAWQVTKPMISRMLIGSRQVEQISVEKWQELNTYRSIKLKFPYRVNSSTFLDLISDETYKIDKEDEFDEILIVVGDRDTVYFANSIENTYFSVFGDSIDIMLENELKTLLTYVESSEQGIYHSVEDHYDLKKLLGNEDVLFVPNDTLMPRFQVEEIPVVKVEKEIDITDNSEATQNIIQSYIDYAFEGSNNFVNRLQDVDGSIVWIYGYGERAIKLGVNGEIEYKEKFDQSISGETLNIKDSLKVAIDFIEKFGGVPNGIYLRSINETKGVTSKGYRFTFANRVQGYTVVNSKLNSGDAIEIEVYGTQVLSYKRLVRKYLKLAEVPEIMEKQYTIDDVFNMNFDKIHDDYQSIEEAPFDKNRIYEILQNIEDVKIVYYSDIQENSQRLIPAWRIKIGKNTYLFNMHTGKMLKTYRTKS